MSIPIDRLQDKTSLGLQIIPFHPQHNTEMEHDVTTIHRDDHYVFFVIKAGVGKLQVDFQEFVINSNQIFYILPSQMHSKIKSYEAEGWFLAIDPSIIPEDLRDLFEFRLNLQSPCCLKQYRLKQLDDLLLVLHREILNECKDELHIKIVQLLASSFLGMAASALKLSARPVNFNKRSEDLARQFKILVSENVVVYKKPSDYAGIFNITTGYLNEVIKEYTGSPVSFWIQQEISIRAKRALFYTSADVKQIAHQLGFDDHSYFVRYFRKINGISPLKFRSLNRPD